MPRGITAFVHGVDAMNRFIGRIAMYLIFVLIGVLLWSSVSKVAFLPSLWTLETAQFIMVGYYILGGPYSIQLGSNVRMDLFYGSWSVRTKAWVDAVTVLFLMFYLGVLLYGALGSLAYAMGYFGMAPLEYFAEFIAALFTGGFAAAGEMLGYLERSSTAWRPFLWPVKLLLAVGIFLMLLQTLAEFFRDIGRIRGVEI
ncbi:TRAP transporter small permease subunit [Marinovum sp.]|uniref:TRAP transporter small permease subunit n=1 Tax=Marinovum sp. TaxID=2024839 RepID=UPI002B26AF81|nr:TRAP transporter small permease subunit [Marinovum sp.]